ncbi:MAG TPA: M14 family metallopeptidase [Gemmatimonadaceae bacterium]|nr:M14 family metallopeptidase [Gemmatimonadaceae bacterium]
MTSVSASLRALAALALALGAVTAPASAQFGGFGGNQPPRDTVRRVHVVPGLRDGPSMFPLANYAEMKPKQWGVMDFEHYHTTAEIDYWMERWAKEKPDLVELYEVGKSFGGAPLMQMTLTNKKTGKHTDKPAAFFEGGRHSGEITSTESVLWMAWHLVENYGKDASITKLLDENAIYLRPYNNPDGGDMYKLTAQTNRSSVRPVDNDGDGLFDEDPAEDLDGDGHSRQMRKFVGAGKGNAVVDTMDAKKRLMRNVGQGNGDYMLYPEGIDNDKDGRINEDGVGGLDLHRNYPYNWKPMAEATGRGYTQFGAGEYPLSEPETRAVYIWQLTHPNISVTNSMDTQVPMHLRGPSTCEEKECVFPQDLKLMHHFDSVGLSKTNYPWAGDVYRTYATRFAPPGQGQPEPLFGHGPDFGYFQMGQIWYGDELWNGGRERDYNGDGRWDQYEVLRYCDEEFGGTCFQPWTKVQHPDLGEVEVGGFNPKFWSQNGPPQALEKWAKNQALFNLEMAKSLPRVEITNVVVSKVRMSADSATHEAKVTVRNHGRIPTALEQAKRVKAVPQDMLTIEGPRGSQARAIGRGAQFWLGGFETKTVTIRLRVPAGTEAVMNARLSSVRGGVSDREVRITP